MLLPGRRDLVVKVVKFGGSSMATAAQMRNANEAMEAAMLANDRLAVARADGAFHEALIENSGNHYLIEAYRLVSGRVAALRAHNLTSIGDVRNRSMAEHKSIIAAISSGELARAESILGEHIIKMRDAFHAAKERESLAEPKPSRRRSTVDIVLNDA